MFINEVIFCRDSWGTMIGRVHFHLQVLTTRWNAISVSGKQESTSDDGWLAGRFVSAG